LVTLAPKSQPAPRCETCQVSMSGSGFDQTRSQKAPEKENYKKRDQNGRKWQKSGKKWEERGRRRSALVGSLLVAVDEAELVEGRDFRRETTVEANDLKIEHKRRKRRWEERWMEGLYSAVDDAGDGEKVEDLHAHTPA